MCCEKEGKIKFWSLKSGWGNKFFKMSGAMERKVLCFQHADICISKTQSRKSRVNFLKRSEVFFGTNRHRIHQTFPSIWKINIVER